MTNKFVKRLDSLNHNIWLKIAKLESYRGKWDGSISLHPQILHRLKKSVLVTSTGASTRIEGSKLTDLEIENLIKGLSIEKFSTRDEQEVRGYYQLLENVFNNWDSVKFSENTIKHFHKELLKYVVKDRLHRGEYKKSENTVRMLGPNNQDLGVLFETTRAYLTPKEMNELVDWTNVKLNDKEIHPILIIANFVVEFLNIHPYTDGNGRLSRILTNLLLLKEGYLYMPYVSHEKIIEEHKPDYYLALRSSQKTLRQGKSDISPWLNYFLDILIIQAKSALQLITGEHLEKLLSPSQQKVFEYLGSHGEVGPKELSEKLNIARPTINQIVTKLGSLKIVERLGAGSATRYRKL